MAIAAGAVGRGEALTVDGAGNLVVADLGPDQQLKVVASDGRVLRSTGRRGGLAPRRPFDAQTVAAVSGVAVEESGDLRAVEHSELPRGVSVWGKDGTLASAYVGNTSYAVPGSYLHDQDPNLAYNGAVELRRDGAARTWSVASVLCAPLAERGERLAITGSLATPQRFTNAASGAPREYLFAHSDWGEHGLTVFMAGDGGWKPVAAVTLVGHLSGGIAEGKATGMPIGTFAGCDPFDGAFWNDANADGVATRDECEVVSAAKPAGAVGAERRGPLSVSCGLGTRMADDLTIYVDGLVAYAPIGFTAAGVPRYASSVMRRLPVEDRGDLLPLDGERWLGVLSCTGYGGESYLCGLEYGTWRELWRYPSRWHGVHGSHHAGLPSPGTIIGALKFLGAARMDDGVSALAIRGKLGQDFLVGADGLYVGELFRDCRRPSTALPNDETSLVGARIDTMSEGGEPFSGWFGR